MVLFILAVVWAVYLISWVRSRTEHRRVNSINSFSKHLSTLERTTPGRRPAPAAGAVGGGVVMANRPPALSSAKKRRRDILVGLLGATGVTFLAMIVMGGPATYLFGLALVLTLGYVALLATVQKRALERRTKVRYLDPAGQAPAVWAADETWSEGAEAEYGTYALRPAYAVNGR